ncbi:MAG TPA: biopolymer transporter ExbD, partial [Ramlibacter sp.]|nr:biopolymer transporter ExbD [Ramlibacter sp.]
LPQAEGTQPVAAPPYVSVVLDAAGQLYLQDQPVDAAGLARQLAAAARRDPDTEIQLRADRAVPYGRVAEVMGIANQAGLNRIGFVAEPAKN